MKNLLIGLILVVMVGCISTNMTRKENLETNLANAKVMLAVADSLIYTEKLDAKYQEDIDNIKDIIVDVRFMLEDGEDIQAIKTWQEGAILLIKLNNKIYDAKK